MYLKFSKHQIMAKPSLKEQVKSGCLKLENPNFFVMVIEKYTLLFIDQPGPGAARDKFFLD